MCSPFVGLNGRVKSGRAIGAEHGQTAGMSRARIVTPTRVGAPRSGGLWPWLSISVGLHVLALLLWPLFLFLLSLLGIRGADLFSPGGSGVGDGFGGNSIEVEIAGPRDAPPQGSISAGRDEREPPPPPSQATPPPAQEMTADQGELAVRAEEPPDPRPRAETEQPVAPPRRELRDTGDPTAPTVAAPGRSEQAAGTGANDSTAGVAGGDPTQLILGSAGALGDTASAQRALLPNGGMCEDPVRGTWRAQKYRSSDRSWVRFVLRVERDGDILTGTITSRIWTGNPSDPRPGRCTAFGSDHTWLMDAVGRLDGNRMTFLSQRSRMIREDCPSSDARYAPDNFTGRVDPMRDVFESLNNDGAYDIDEPYTFRRVSCE